ncbi:hypothetical protein [Bacillus cereus]|uniref:hypothetical protein n=1 Tax=Bacillus cereus TaxID=1396 RepID=UPI0037C0DD78
MNILENENLVEDNTDIYRDLEDVVSALKMAKEENINVNLLIGAGCSVTANIPAAQGMIDTIKEKYPREFKRAKIKDYPNCMSKLTPSERKNLISQTIKDAKINWTHIAIAQLLKHGYINRILTPNFDNLVQRACALVGEFPGIYDLTTSSEFKKDLLFDKSVIHLHGQHTGFILCNTETEVEEQYQTLKPVFQQLDEKSLWIVIGYSGNNDPIFKLLSKKNVFEHRLFWIGYEDNEPSKMLSDELLSEEKYAFFVKGFNSDDFFVRLSQQLDSFPPAFIQKPFTYLSETLDTLADYKLPIRYTAKNKNKDLNNHNPIHIITKNVVQKAIVSIENNKALMAQHFLMAGLFDETIKLGDELTSKTDSEIDLELEYQIINALNEKGDFEKAIDRLKILCDKFPNDYKVHNELASHYMSVGISYYRLNNPKTFNSNIFKMAIDLYKKAYDLSPSANSIASWEICLVLVHEYLYEKEEIRSFLFEATNTYLDHLIDFKTDANLGKSLEFSGLFMIVSSYIEHQNFEEAKSLLEKVKDLEFSTECQASVFTTWGLWYFRNDSIDNNIALKNAINYYTTALNLLDDFNNETANETADDTIINIKKKFLLEHAKFLLQHNLETTDNPTSLLYECIKLGELGGSDTSIEKEATDILESIQSHNTSESTVASTTTKN